MMKSVVTVLGMDRTGIIAGVSSVCAREEVNILDIHQTTMEGTFVMIMFIEGPDSRMAQLRSELEISEKKLKVKINVYNEEVFRAMHRV